MSDDDLRLAKYMRGLAGVRPAVAVGIAKLQGQLDDLSRRLDVIERVDHQPLFYESFGMPSALEAMTSPRWLN